ncbi:MAG: amino acid ABC transporter substrate-binding protein [Candidatus Micrarchaeota archaeon]|nr:amino acid ABC transporter substrate-binding protein [Candidatus Micrarchaeota archaeon]
MKKGNNMALIVAVIAIVMSIASITAALSASSAQVVQKEDTFDRITREGKAVVCYVTWPPSVVKDPDTGEVKGFLIEMIRNIADDAGFDLQLVESSWGGFAADLKTGKCDMAIAGIYPTIKRSTSVSFTRPFYYAGNGALKRKGDARFKTISDLNKPGVRVAVLQGEFGHIYAQKYLPKAQLIVLDKTADNTAPLVAVSSGQADVGLIMSDVVEGYAKEHADVEPLSDQPYSTTPITWAVRSDDQKLLNFLNNAISYLEAVGDLDNVQGGKESQWYKLKREYVRLGA